MTIIWATDVPAFKIRWFKDEGISETVGNGLCAVPERCKYNLCGQPEPPTGMSFRTNAVSRGIFPSGKFYLVLVLSPTWWIPPLRLRYGRNDIAWGRFYGFAYRFWNVLRRPAASSVRAAPCQLPPGEAKGAPAPVRHRRLLCNFGVLPVRRAFFPARGR